MSQKWTQHGPQGPQKGPQMGPDRADAIVADEPVASDAGPAPAPPPAAVVDVLALLDNLPDDDVIHQGAHRVSEQALRGPLAQ
jgi:hypothetical protein